MFCFRRAQRVHVSDAGSAIPRACALALALTLTVAHGAGVLRSRARALLRVRAGARALAAQRSGTAAALPEPGDAAEPRRERRGAPARARGVRGAAGEVGQRPQAAAGLLLRDGRWRREVAVSALHYGRLAPSSHLSAPTPCAVVYFFFALFACLLGIHMIIIRSLAYRLTFS